MNAFENLGTHSFAYSHTCGSVFESQHTLFGPIPSSYFNLGHGVQKY
jgi:hypothetical protein